MVQLPSGPQYRTGDRPPIAPANPVSPVREGVNSTSSSAQFDPEATFDAETDADLELVAEITELLDAFAWQERRRWIPYSELSLRYFDRFSLSLQDTIVHYTASGNETAFFQNHARFFATHCGIPGGEIFISLFDGDLDSTPPQAAITPAIKPQTPVTIVSQAAPKPVPVAMPTATVETPPPPPPAKPTPEKLVLSAVVVNPGTPAIQPPPPQPPASPVPTPATVATPANTTLEATVISEENSSDTKSKFATLTELDNYLVLLVAELLRKSGREWISFGRLRKVFHDREGISVDDIIQNLDPGLTLTKFLRTSDSLSIDISQIAGRKIGKVALSIQEVFSNN